MALDDTLQEMRTEMSEYFAAVTEKMSEVGDRIGRLGDHVTNTNNPHRVDKEDVGLGDVQNFPVASRDDALEGSSNFHYMTPLRTHEAMDELFGAIVEAFEEATSDINE